MVKNRDEKRRRVTPDFMRQVAAMSSSGGRNILKLPKGVTEYQGPEKSGTYYFDFLPYLVTCTNHPDRVEKDVVWWRYPFVAYQGIGVNQEWIVSPISVGLPCPITEHRDRLKQDYDKNESAIKALAQKKFVLYALKDPKDKDKVALLYYSQFKLGDALDVEIAKGRDEDIYFFWAGDGMGRTVGIQFEDEKYEGRAYLKAVGGKVVAGGKFQSAFEYKPRKDMDEAEVLAKVPALESCLNILPYDTIKAIFLGVGEDSPNAQDAGGGEESRPAPKATPPGSPKTKAGKPTPPPVQNVEEPEEAEDDETPTFAVGDWVTGTADTDEPVAGEVITVSSDGTDIEVKDVNGDTYDCVASSLEKTTPPASAKKGANPPSNKTAKAKGGAKRYENAAGLEFGVGDTVEDGEGATGVITAIDEANEDATCKPKKGAEFTLDWDDIKKVAGGAAAESEEEEEEYTPAVGDEVEWDEGEGEILKLRATDNKAKVKTAAGPVWVEIAKLSEK